MQRFRIIKDAKGNTCQVQDGFANVEAESTDHVLVAAQVGKRIAVLMAVFQTGGTATTSNFTSLPAVSEAVPAPTGSDLGMTFQNGANGGAVLPFNDNAYFIAKRGERLALTTGEGSTTGVQFNFAYID